MSRTKIDKKAESLRKVENTNTLYLRFKRKNLYICQNAPLYAIATFLEIPKIELKEIIANGALKHKKQNN
ncbi:hypothetical protein [Sphingobacterium hungaricum]|nr:hypothetical protein [Sphingobacterium hungaricum]